MNTFIHSRRGQTLVEALVALSILTTGFVGIVVLLTKSFQLNRTTSNDTQATYLAAEGIEIAKSIVDYDVYSGLPTNNYWQCSFGLNPGQSAHYELEYYTTVSGCTPLTSVLAAKAQSDHLYFNASTTLYSYDNFSPAVETDFTRDVRVSVPLNSPNELDVQSTVTWTDGGSSDTITLEDHFYNYQ
jgi:Tfp pilus assembly protein PilV